MTDEARKAKELARLEAEIDYVICETDRVLAAWEEEQLARELLAAVARVVETPEFEKHFAAWKRQRRAAARAAAAQQAGAAT